MILYGFGPIWETPGWSLSPERPHFSWLSSYNERHSIQALHPRIRSLSFGNDEDGTSVGVAITFLLIGVGAGALAALLFAPKSGEQLRRDIRRRYKDAKGAVEGFADEAKERVGGLRGARGGLIGRKKWSGAPAASGSRRSDARCGGTSTRDRGPIAGSRESPAQYRRKLTSTLISTATGWPFRVAG